MTLGVSRCGWKQQRQKGMVIGMNNVVITIARQYGSGGRTIGEMLAKKLNVHYYDKELMKLASDDSGINEALFVNADEKVKNTSLFHIAKKEYHGELIPTLYLQRTISVYPLHTQQNVRNYEYIKCRTPDPRLR